MCAEREQKINSYEMALMDGIRRVFDNTTSDI